MKKPLKENDHFINLLQLQKSYIILAPDTSFDKLRLNAAIYMHNFWLYFSLGREHIANFRGLDHILFVTALCIRYLYIDWKKLLVLITAFTVGHSATLALSVFHIVHISGRWVEFLIPLTIVVTRGKTLCHKSCQYQRANGLPIERVVAQLCWPWHHKAVSCSKLLFYSSVELHCRR